MLAHSNINTIQIQTHNPIFQHTFKYLNWISCLLQMFSYKGGLKKPEKNSNLLGPTYIPLRQKCDKIIAGPFHSYGIAKNLVYLWGKKMSHHLNEQPRQNSNQSNNDEKLVQIPIKIDILATGPHHTFAWNQREVYCWGSNENYELGLEEQRVYGCQKVDIFEQAMKNGYHLEQIQCGQSHSLAIFRVPQFEKQEELFPNSLSEITEREQDNEQEGIQMFAWGKSQSSQLTINSTSIIPYPVLAPCSFKHLTSVHSKSDYNAALCNNKVYTWGGNLFSRLGNIESKVRIPLQVPLPTKIIKIGLGNHHVVAVSVNGSAYSWGKGDLGQLGIDKFQTQSRPTKMVCEEKIVDAVCGDLHTLILLQSNQMRTCGGNKNGALGHSHYDPSDKKKRCKKLQRVQGVDKFGKIVMIASGSHHNLILNSNGEVFGWGNNDHYQILPNQDKKEHKQDMIRRPKKPLEIIVDQDSKKSIKFEQEASQLSIGSYLQKLGAWTKKYDAFRQQKARQQDALMKEYHQILEGMKKMEKS